MSHSGYLLIDGSNLAFACTATRKLSVGSQETQGVYGFLRSLRPLVASYSMLTPIVLWDAASWRYKVFPEYKASRKLTPTSKIELELAHVRASLKTQLPFLKKALEALGVRQMSALNMEADDLAGILVQRYVGTGKKIMLISGDGDWIQLVQPGVGWFHALEDRRLSHATLSNRLGWKPGYEKPHAKTGKMTKVPGSLGYVPDGSLIPGFIPVPSGRAWLEMKALMGDTSDDIPGVGGIGDKGALELVTQFGSVGAFLNQSVDGTLPELPKKFKDFAESNEKQAIFDRNMVLMELGSKFAPQPINLAINHGSPSDADFGSLCRDLSFQSLLTNLPEWVEPFRKIAA